MFTFSALIRACEAGQQWQRAFGFLDQMRQDELEPDKATLSALIVACEESQLWQRALGLLEET